MKVKTKLTPGDWGLLIAAIVILSGVLIAGWLAIGTPATGIVLIAGVGVILFAVLQGQRKLLEQVRRSRADSEQLGDLFGLYFALSGMLPPLPKTGGYAASADFLRVIYEQTRTNRPNLVIELGSGSSTVIGGYALRQNGSGRLVSIDHLDQYAEQSRSAVSFHGLDNYCRVLVCPLTNHSVGDGHWQWYSLENVDPGEAVDLVIVDGPPRRLQELSRYPALPVLSSWLSKGVTIIVDDADRPDEQRMISKWIEENPRLQSEYLGTRKGTCILYYQ